MGQHTLADIQVLPTAARYISLMSLAALVRRKKALPSHRANISPALTAGTSAQLGWWHWLIAFYLSRFPNNSGHHWEEGGRGRARTASSSVSCALPDASLLDGIKHLCGRLAMKIIYTYRKSIKKCQGRLRAAWQLFVRPRVRLGGTGVGKVKSACCEAGGSGGTALQNIFKSPPHEY